MMRPAKSVAEHRVLAIELVDVVAEQTRDAVSGALGPARLQVVNLIAEHALERAGQFADQILEEPGKVGLQPAGRLAAAGREKQQQVSVRRGTGRCSSPS